MKMIFAFAFVLSMHVCYSQDSTFITFKKYAREHSKKVRTILLKVKQGHIKEYFFFNKDNKQLDWYQKANKATGELIIYLFENTQLIYVKYLPRRKRNNQRRGGIYYFIHGDLKEKFELDVNKDPNNFLLESIEIIKRSEILSRIKSKNF